MRIRRLFAALAALAAFLPQGAGRDYGFVLRPDAPDIFSRLRHGQALLAKRRALLDGLTSPPPPNANRQPW